MAILHLEILMFNCFHKKIEYAAAVIPNQPTQTQVNQELQTGTQSSESSSRYHEYLQENSPLIRLHDLIHNKMRLWDPVNPPIIGNYDKDEKKYSTHDGLELPDGESLSLDVIRVFDIGSECAIQYCQRYYITNPFQVDRSEKTGVDLTKLLWI
jgi:hypothetical protein